MKIEDLIAQARKVLSDKLAERQTKTDELTECRSKLDAGDDTVTEAKVREIIEARKAVDDEIAHAQERVAEYEAEKASDDAAARMASEVLPPKSRERAPIVVGKEERTYNPGNDKRGKGFLADVAGNVMGDFSATERLSRHMAEERAERGADFDTRAAATTAFAGLVVPQYLTDLYAPAVAALRPFANVSNIHELPAAGMTVNISRITTATSAATVAENTAVSETNIDDTLLSPAVQIAAGQQTLSRAVVERGTGAEDVTIDDLFRRHATAIDSAMINQATNGLTNVAQNVAYTDASPTAAELWPKVLNAVANVEAVLLHQGPADYAIMHSRRWAWMQSQVGTSWPFIAQPGIPTQAGGQNDAQPYDSGVRGTLPNGLRVIVDNNIGTTLGAGTEDEIYIVNSRECHLWEDPSAPMLIRAEQPAAASLGVLFVVYSYFAYTLARYTNGSGKISGTGLIAPVF